MFAVWGIKDLVNGLRDADFNFLKTEGGNIIPWEKVLDMAFWYAYKHDDNWLIN